jgi:hypothetical protein
MIRDFFAHNFAKVHEINKKYAKPNVEMSGWVKGSLLFLRIYLVLLVGLLIYKFITLL